MVYIYKLIWNMEYFYEIPSDFNLIYNIISCDIITQIFIYFYLYTFIYFKKIELLMIGTDKFNKGKIQYTVSRI